MKKIKSIFLLPVVVIRRVIAVLDFPGDIDDFITYANGIHNSMKANPLFAALLAKLAILLTNIGLLETAQNGFHTKPPTTTKAVRDNALLAVQNNLRDLRSEVQTLADADPANAENIITASGMKVKKPGAINKQDFVVKDGTVSGRVKLIAKGIGKAHAAHDWAMSADGNNWTPVTPTLQADTEINGLTPGTKLDFRHRNILKDGPTDWIEVNDYVVR